MKTPQFLKKTDIVVATLLLFAFTANAQTQAIRTLKVDDGTNSTPQNSDALIDMQSGTRGLLLPRVQLTSTAAAAPLATHTAGMVVYNTVSAGSAGTAVTPGYYYNDGTQWVRQGGGSNNNWALSGNAGTAATTDFIGTSDAMDFATKTNGTERLRITSDGKLLVGTSTSLTGGSNTIVQINNGTVNGALQIVDGTQGAGKILTSDANGVATWTTGNNSLWTLSGNSGITANNAAYGTSLTAGTGNWLGTINSADLILAANNKEGLRINSAQQVLIGTTTVPTGGTTAKVIIDNGTTNGALQIKDGTQGAGKYLTSDANGVATWTELTPSSYDATSWTTLKSASGAITTWTTVLTYTATASLEYIAVATYGLNFGYTIDQLDGSGAQIARMSALDLVSSGAGGSWAAGSTIISKGMKIGVGIQCGSSYIIKRAVLLK